MSQTLSQRLVSANKANPHILSSIPAIVTSLNNMGLTTITNANIVSMKTAGTFTPQMEAGVNELMSRYMCVLATYKDLGIIDLGTKIQSKLLEFFNNNPTYDYVLESEYNMILAYLATL